MAKKKIAKPEKQKKEVTSEEALMVLNKKARAKELRVAQRIEQVLQEEGYKLEVIHKIVTVPIR